MKFLAVIAALLVAPGLAMAQDSTAPTKLDRFKLWNECRPIELEIASLPNDAAEIDLTEERVGTIVRSRLRVARIYKDGISSTLPFLFVAVNVVGQAYNVNFTFHKPVTDLASNEQGFASTWNIRGTGTHGRGGGGFILQYVSEHTDKFIDEYLRVNAEAC